MLLAPLDWTAQAIFTIAWFAYEDPIKSHWSRGRDDDR